MFNGDSLLGSESSDRNETSSALTCAGLGCTVLQRCQLKDTYIQDCRPFVSSENVETDAATLSIDIWVEHSGSKFALQRWCER